MRRLLVLLIVLLTGVAHANGPPPAELHLVGDHWTAWDPPSEFPAGAQLYLIRAGDTLWDLAGQYYGDPYLWPQIWEQNRYIQDAHWIYPGDPLVVGIEVTPIEEIGEMAGEDEAPSEMADPRFDPASGAPVPLGSADDIFCSGYIGDPDETFPMTVIGSEYGGLDIAVASSWGERRLVSASSNPYGQPRTSKLGLVLGDIVYLDRGREAGLLPGSVHIAVQPGEMVKHVDTDELLGRSFYYRGRVRLLSVQETSAIGEIIHSCGPIEVGVGLKPFEDTPIPLARRTGLRGINDPVPLEQLQDAPVIALSEGGRVTLGQGHLVFIDRGAEDDVTPGDIFTIYRVSAKNLPPMVIGELAILAVEPTTALGKILESRFSVHVGDRLDLK